jgi:hypothetical protein
MPLIAGGQIAPAHDPKITTSNCSPVITHAAGPTPPLALPAGGHIPNLRGYKTGKSEHDYPAKSVYLGPSAVITRTDTPSFPTARTPHFGRSPKFIRGEVAAAMREAW